MTLDALAAAMEQARMERRWSYRNLERKVYDVLGDITPTHQTFALWCKGHFPKAPNLEVLIVTASLLGINLVELAPELAPRLERIIVLAGGGPEDQESVYLTTTDTQQAA